MGRTACTETHGLHSTEILLLKFWVLRPVVILSALQLNYTVWIFSASILHRSSVPVQYIYISTPLLAVQTVQILSACRVER